MYFCSNAATVGFEDISDMNQNSLTLNLRNHLHEEK